MKCCNVAIAQCTEQDTNRKATAMIPPSTEKKTAGIKSSSGITTSIPDYLNLVLTGR